MMTGLLLLILADGPDPPPEWALLFEHSYENHLDPGPDNSDGAVLVPEPSPNWMSEIRRLESLGSDCVSSFKAISPSCCSHFAGRPSRQASSHVVVAPLLSPAAATRDLLSDSIASSLPNPRSPQPSQSLGSEFERVATEASQETEPVKSETAITTQSSLIDHSPVPLPEPPDGSEPDPSP